MDAGSQMILLYLDFYKEHLKHPPLQKLEELETWCIVTQKFPYDEYPLIKLTLYSSVAEQSEIFNILAVVVPLFPQG